MKDLISRREALRRMGLLGASFVLAPSFGLLSGCSGPARNPSATYENPGDFSSLSPMNRGALSAEVTGDDFSLPHDALWDVGGWMERSGWKWPAPSERENVVVIGGGMSGLFSAYFLRGHSPLLLEQAKRFGGNSKGEVWQGQSYALGAAYFSGPERGGFLEKLYGELGLFSFSRKKSSFDPVLLKGKIYRQFWDGETDPAQKKDFEKVISLLEDHLLEQNGRHYPGVPPENSKQRRELKRLNRFTFQEYLEKELGKLHPHVHLFLENYCWSTLGAYPQELNAGLAVSMLAADVGDVWAAKGGNGAIAERVLDRLSKILPREKFRAGELVVRVAKDPTGGSIVYSYSKEFGIRAISAKAVVFAAPKFVAAKVIDGISPERKSAFQSIPYRGYLVANVLLNSAPSEKLRELYDLFLMGDGTDRAAPPFGSLEFGPTDVVNNSFGLNPSDRSVLTLYQALPFDGGRMNLFEPQNFAALQATLRKKVVEEILPALGIPPSAVQNIRYTRWGHPLPVAKRGQYQRAAIERLRAPFEDRVWFVEQDNWLAPAMETAILEAKFWSDKIDQRLRKSV